MQDVLAKLSHPRRNAVTATNDVRSCTVPSFGPEALEDLAHEVRQPLSVIESLAYYLEITTTDEKVGVHLQQIRAMVLQVNRILDRSTGSDAHRSAPL